MKKLILSLTFVVGATVAVIGATVAFFSDTETSKGNTFTAGAIDLKIDNHSYFNGEYNEGTSWEPADLQDGVHFFFDFDDLKPGDWGEDTISLHVNNNDAWVCSDLYVTRNDDMSSTEPELEDGDVQEDPQDTWDGELAQAINFIFWIDDGDNVLEQGEEVLANGPASEAIGGLHFVLADSSENNLGGEDGEPVEGGSTYYIGKAWCFGEITPDAVPEGQGDPGSNPGFECDGEPINNVTQTDKLTADISFYAVQSRNNGDFVCSSHYSPEDRTILRLENKDDAWDPIVGDGIRGELSFISAHPTFDFSLEVQGLQPNTSYTLIRYKDPWPGTGSDEITTLTTDGDGNATVNGDVELNKDLNDVKFWVVSSSDWDGGKMTAWHQSEYLFEWNLVSYDDTDI